MSNNSQMSTLDQLRSRTANRRSRRASRQQSLTSPASSTETGELDGVEGNKYTTPRTSSRHNSSRGSTGAPKTPMDTSRPTTTLSSSGREDGDLVSLKPATPLVNTRLVEEKSEDSKEFEILDDIKNLKTLKNLSTIPPPGPPPSKLRRASKSAIKNKPVLEEAPAKRQPSPEPTFTPTKRVSIADTTNAHYNNEYSSHTNQVRLDDVETSDLEGSHEDPAVQISISSPYITPKSNSTPEKMKPFTSPGSQFSSPGMRGAARRSLLACGKAEHGRLGLHSNSSSHVLLPQPLRDFTGRIQNIAAGRDHTLALSADGSIFSWGLGHDGRLGLGTEDDAPHPTKISFGPIADQIVTMIACGEMHCLAVTESRKMFSWGRNYYGRLGHGDSNNRSVPEMIRSLSHLSILNISAGVAYSAAVSVEGNLFTWGYGGHGQLGHNDQKNYSQPFMVKSMSDEIVTKVEAAYGHTLCLTATGELFAWGSGHGLLGLSDPNPRLIPTKVALLSNVEIINICSGYDHSLALSSVGEVYSWGNGGYGQLGQSEGNLCISTPEVVNGLNGQQCVNIAAGEYSSVAITAVGSIFSWGGGFGALGHEDVKNVYEPKLVDALRDCNVVSCSVGSIHSVILVESNGTLRFETENSDIGEDDLLQEFDDESSLEEKPIAGETSLESSVSSMDFDAPLLSNPGTYPTMALEMDQGGEAKAVKMRGATSEEKDGGNSSKQPTKQVGESSPLFKNTDGTSSLGHVDKEEWLDEGEGAISLRVSETSKYTPQSPELYSRETLWKYGDTLARFGYQGFSGEENYRKKYAMVGEGGVPGEEEESPPTHKYPAKDNNAGCIGVRTPTTYMRSTPSTGRTIGSTTFYNNVISTHGGGRSRGGAVGKGGIDLMRWLEKHELGELFDSLSGSGFGSLGSLTKNVEFTDVALEEMGIFKKGLRMQFMAALKQLRSFRLYAGIVRGEGMRGGSWCGPTRRRVSTTWSGDEKITRVAAGKKPAWSETLVFQPVDQNEAKRGEVVMEVVENGVKCSSCTVRFEEIDKFASDIEIGDGKPYPLVSKEGEMVGCIWVKLFLKRGDE